MSISAAGLGSDRFLRAGTATPSKSHRLADRSRSRVFGKHCVLILSSSIRFGLCRERGHCRATEDCHGDVLIEEFRRLYPAAHDRNQPRGVPPGPDILSFLARLREEPESDEGFQSGRGRSLQAFWPSRQRSTYESGRWLRTARVL